MQLNKALIAAAVTAALTVSATANAEATVYGKIHTSVAAVTSDAGTEYNATEIKSNASRIGFKSSKKLDNGMTFSGQAEFEIDAAGDKNKSSADLIKLRNTYVGLKGGFGEVRVGNHDTPYKIATSKLDVFGDTYADYNNIIQNDNRVGNAIAYLNKFGPVGIAAAYSTSISANDTATAGGENLNSATSVMANYEMGPIYVTGALETIDDQATGKVEDAKKVGVGYKVGGLKLGLAYETLGLVDAKRVNETYVSAKYKLNDTTSLKGAYGSRDTRVTGAKEEIMTAVGVDYKMDKQVSVYALYANGSDGGLAHKGKLAGDGTALALGLVYKF